MRLITLLLISLCLVSVKGRTIKTFAKDRQAKHKLLTKKDETLDSNLQNDLMDNEMNHSNNGDRFDDGMMDDEDDEITKAEENLGMHYFQGDVLTTNDQMTKLNHMLDSGSQADDQLQSRALVKDVRRTWGKGVVPYVIRSGVDKFRRGIVKAAIKHWEKKTCLKFKERKQEKDYVQFQQGNGCSSYVGRIGGKQNVIVGNKRHKCRVGNIIHEIGHTVGFFHEQSRPDRDQFVKIAWRNVKNGYRVNFMKFSTRVIDSKDVGYDYDSIMHYPRKIFGKKSSKPTVIPKKDPKAKIGQRIALSKLDVLQVGKLYACPAKSDTNIETDMNNNSDTNNSNTDIDSEMNPM